MGDSNNFLIILTKIRTSIARNTQILMISHTIHKKKELALTLEIFS